jgi:hypothetical protein
MDVSQRQLTDRLGVTPNEVATLKVVGFIHPKTQIGNVVVYDLHEVLDKLMTLPAETRLHKHAARVKSQEIWDALDRLDAEEEEAA